jgi:hypothetical protein
MIARLLNLLGVRPPTQVAAAAELPAPLQRAELAQFLVTHINIPQLDHSKLATWLDASGADAEGQWRMVRSVAAAWLDELRGALGDDYVRWRHAGVEGLAPAADGMARRAADVANHALAVLRHDLGPLLVQEQVPPVALVAFSKIDDYISFTDYFHESEGEFAGSGGMYLHGN